MTGGRKKASGAKPGDMVKVGGGAPPARKVAAKKAAPKKAPAKKDKAIHSPIKPENAERLKRWQAWRERPDAIDELCEFITGGTAEHSLTKFCEGRGFLLTTVLKWLAADEERQRIYDLACRHRGQVMFDNILTVANEPVPSSEKGLDGAAVADKRLRVDTLKWAAGRMDPKRFGDKVQVGGADDLPPVAHKVEGTLEISPSEAYMRMIGKRQ